LFNAAFIDLFLVGRQMPRSARELELLNPEAVGKLGETTRMLEALVGEIAGEYSRISLRRAGLSDPVYQESVADVDRQLDWLLQPGFLSRTPAEWRSRLPVYLRALEWRLAKLPERLPRDLEWTWEVTSLAATDANRSQQTSLFGKAPDNYHWLLQEYRVSLFAQHLGTVVPVSRMRLERLRGD